MMWIQVDETDLKMDDCRYFFRGWWLVALATSSQLDGLKRKYPKAWLKRKSYPFYRHIYARDLDLKKEYYFNLAYCLAVYAKENDHLKAELTSFYTKAIKSETDFFKKNAKKPHLITEHIRLICGTVEHFRPEPFEILVNLTVHDVLMEIYSFTLEKELANEFIGYYNEAGQRFFERIGENRLFQIKTFIEPLRTKRGKVYQFLMDYAKRVSLILEEPVLTYIKRELSSFVNKDRLASTEKLSEVLWDIKRGLNTEIKIELINTLSYHEVLEIMAMMAFSCSIEPSKDGTMPSISDKQWEKLLTFGQNQLLIYAIEYLVAKTHEKNRHLLFRLSDATDLVALRQLETQLNNTKKELKQEREQRIQSDCQIEKLKQEQSDLVLKEVNEQKRCLIKANQLIAKQAQENETLKLELEKYKVFAEVLNSQLSQVNQSIDDEVSFSLSDEVLSIANQPTILFVGGHPKLVSRLKGLLPQAKFFEVDKNYDVQFCQTINQIFILGDYVNHGMVYRVSKYIDAPKRVLFGSNVTQLIQQCANVLLNQSFI